MVYLNRTVTDVEEQELNYERSCNTTEKSTINYATENAVLSLCSMNIAKEPLGHIQVYCDKHFITLTGAMTRCTPIF